MFSFEDYFFYKSDVLNIKTICKYNIFYENVKNNILQ